MQELTDEKIIADFKINPSSLTAAQEIEDIRQAIANAVVTKITMSDLSENQVDTVAKISDNNPEKIHDWLASQGINIEAVFEEVYAEHLDNFNLLSQ